MSGRKTSKIVCKGGLNTSSPDYEILPGQVIHANNVEQGIRGGYRRIDGYERFDGRAVPSEVSYWQVACSALTTAIPEGAEVSIGAATALTSQAHAVNDLFLFLASPDTIPANTAVTFLGNTVSTTEAPITSRYSTDLADMTLWDAAMSKWRALIKAVPGSGPIRGVAMREGEVVAFRDTLSGAEAEGFKATGEFSVREKQIIYSTGFEATAFGSSSQITSTGGYMVVSNHLDDTIATNAGEAYVFKLKGGAWVLQSVLTASDAEIFDFFSTSVSISSDGNTVVVGAPGEDSSRGAAYVFTRTGTVWTEQQKLTASDVEDDDLFGTSLAISSDGSTVIIGAYGEDGAGTDRGAAYAFTRTGTVWTEQQKLTASDTADSDWFGRSASISSDGSTVILGAWAEDGAGTDRGAAYVFTRTGTVWTEQQKLTASDAEDGDLFGRSISISSDGNTVVVGANGEDTGGAEAGAAYVFSRSGVVWAEQAILLASNAAAGASFGKAVSVSAAGGVVVVGAELDDTADTNAGAIYVFARLGNVWLERDILYSSDASSNPRLGTTVSISSDGLYVIAGGVIGKAYFFRISDGWESITEIQYQEHAVLAPTYLETLDEFGKSVAIDNAGRNLAVGSPNYEDTALNAGLVQLYERYGESWQETDKLLPPNIQEEALFGTSVSMSKDGKALAVGAPETIVQGTLFTEKQKLTASDAAGNDNFGFSVSISEDENTAIIGAHREGGAGTGRGAAYVFTRSGTVWTEQQKLTASDAADNDNFGFSASISEDGNTTIVGAYSEDGAGTNRGAVYVFTRSGTVWAEQQKLVASDAEDQAQFGFSLGLSKKGTTVIIGAYREDSAGTDRGAAYVFTRSGTVWTEQQKLTASDAADNDLFGYSVDMSEEGDTAIVGATGAGVGGAAYMFTYVEGTWGESGVLTPTDAQINDIFGFSVSISGDEGVAIVGAPSEDGAGTDRGAAYVFTRSGTVWTEQQKLAASDAENSDSFGDHVAISLGGNTAIIGAYREDGAGTDRGAAYVFTRSGTVWTEQQKLAASDAADFGQLGKSLSISGNGSVALLGAYGAGSGVAYVVSTQRKAKGTVEYFTKGELAWGLVETITLENDLDSDKFGQTTVLSDNGQVMAVGAPYKEKDGLLNAGFFYVYELGSTWQLRSSISLDSPATDDYLGFSLDLSDNGEVLVVGQYGKTVSSNAGAGAFLIYNKSQGVWNLTQTIDTPNPEASGNFGYSLAISADGLVIAVGAPNEDALGTGDGRVYLYEIASGTASLKQTLVLEGSASDGNDLAFGLSLDLNEDGSTMVVSQGSASEAGMLNTYFRNGDIWTPVFRKSSIDANSIAFGNNVKISPNGDYVACGAPGTLTDTGQAFVFVKNGAALLPSGDYDFDNYNFIGPDQSKNLYGADGVNYGFEYNGNLFRQIRTGADTDTPRHVIAHRQYLFFSFGPSLQHSSISNPHEWLVLTGAAELGIGDEITGFSRLSGGELAIFGRNETDVLYGSSTADWVLAEFSKDTGAYRGSIQSLGVPIYLDDRGVSALTTTIQERGNFSRSTISEIVQAIVDELKTRATASTIVRSKNQYRVFFTNGAGLIFTLSSESEISILPIKYDDTVLKAVSQEGVDGKEHLYFGSDSGFIFKADSGISFDGAAFESSFRLANSGLEFDQYKKRYFKGELLLQAEGYSSIGLTPSLDYETADNATAEETVFTLSDPSGFWGDQGVGFNKTSRVRADIKGVGRTISLLFSSNSKLIYPYTVNSVVLDWSFRKRVN